VIQCASRMSILLLLSGIYNPLWVWADSLWRFRDHTQGRTTVGRTPLDEWSARRRDLNLTTHATLTTDKHPCPRRDSNTQYQLEIDHRHAPLTARPLGSARMSITIWKFTDKLSHSNPRPARDKLECATCLRIRCEQCSEHVTSRRANDRLSLSSLVADTQCPMTDHITNGITNICLVRAEVQLTKLQDITEFQFTCGRHH
jgi:hypothetical protein